MEQPPKWILIYQIKWFSTNTLSLHKVERIVSFKTGAGEIRNMKSNEFCHNLKHSYTDLGMRIYAFTFKPVRPSLHTFSQLHTYTHMHTYSQLHTYTHIHTYIYIRSKDQSTVQRQRFHFGWKMNSNLYYLEKEKGSTPLILNELSPSL